MVPTIAVHGSNGEVMAPLVDAGRYYPTHPRNVRITRVTSDEEVNLSVRQAMVGLEVRATFNHKSLPQVLKKGEVACYLEDLAEVFEQHGNTEAATHLRGFGTNGLDLYLLNAGTYQIA